MSPSETALYKAAIFFFALCLFGGVLRGPESVWRFRWFWSTTLLGWACHTLAILDRSLALGRIPLKITESLTLAVWLAVLGFIVWAKRNKEAWRLGPFVMLFSALGLIYLLWLSPPLEPLPPILKSVWLTVHVLMAVSTLAFVLLGAAGSMVGFFHRKPGPILIEKWELASEKFCLVGFVAWGGMILAGAMWASQAWGSYWSWDPVETSSLATWLLFALYLHLRRLHAWQGKKLALFTLALVVVVFLTVWIVPTFVSTIHSAAKY